MAERDTAKFEVLNLESGWVEAAGHVDYQLSNPGVSMSKSELAATWRSLDPATQRSYMLVAVKKSEACTKGKRNPGSAERYMMLLRYIFELLWVASSQTPRRPTPRKASSMPLPVPKVHAIPALTINAESTATVLPRSPAWYNLTKGEGDASRRFGTHAAGSQCNPVARLRRLATSPLARCTPITNDDLVGEGANGPRDYFDDRLVAGFHGISDDSSDTSSEW